METQLPECGPSGQLDVEDTIRVFQQVWKMTIDIRSWWCAKNVQVLARTGGSIISPFRQSWLVQFLLTSVGLVADAKELVLRLGSERVGRAVRMDQIHF